MNARTRFVVGVVVCLVLAAATAAFCFWQSGNRPAFLLVAPLFCYLRLWFNMLDGMVALASGKASWRGEILNDLPDRVSDVIIFAGVAHSGWLNPFFGYWAAIFALLTAYVGLFGQAVGVQREFSGVMSKPPGSPRLSRIGTASCSRVKTRTEPLAVTRSRSGMRCPSSVCPSPRS